MILIVDNGSYDEKYKRFWINISDLNVYDCIEIIETTQDNYIYPQVLCIIEKAIWLCGTPSLTLAKFFHYSKYKKLNYSDFEKKTIHYLKVNWLMCIEKVIKDLKHSVKEKEQNNTSPDILNSLIKKHEQMFNDIVKL